MKIKLKQKSSWPIVAIDQNHLRSCLNKYGHLHSKWIEWRRRTEGGNKEICQSRVKAWRNIGLPGKRFLSVRLELSNAWQTPLSLWNLLHRQTCLSGRSARCTSEGTGWTWQVIGVQGYAKQSTTGAWSSCSTWSSTRCDVWSWWGGACSKMPSQKEGKA